MARFVSDQNKLVFISESGTFANTSGAGQWLGLITEHNATVSENVQQIRYVGTGTRNVNQHVRGVEDYEGTITMYPQNWQFLAYVLGSCVDGGSPSPYSHVISEVNNSNGNAFTSGTLAPFMSFTLEESQGGFAAGSNTVKTFKGCVANETTISITQGEMTTAEVTYFAQDVVFSSGVATAVTENTTRPFLWEDYKIHLPSGTVLNNVLTAEIVINNNLERRHYLNGSRISDIPIPLNRDYSVTITANTNNTDDKTFFTNYLQSGTEFNMLIEQNCVDAGAGSRAAYFIFSGCRLTSYEAPTKVGEVNEQSLTIIPKSLTVNVDDLNFKYNPW